MIRKNDTLVLGQVPMWTALAYSIYTTVHLWRKLNLDLEPTDQRPDEIA